MSKHFDHEEFQSWLELANSDPDAFEAKREQHIQRFINQCPPVHQQKLHQLQWRIDGIRRRVRSPQKMCIELNKMMARASRKQSKLLNDLRNLCQGAQISSSESAEKAGKKSASILPFSPVEKEV